MNLTAKLSSHFHFKILFSIVIIIIMFSSILTYSFNIGHEMTAKYAPLIDAVMEIELEATNAHLWLEEILSGDSEEKIEDVLKHIDNSRWYANAMINGGENHEGIFMPITDKYLIDKIALTISLLDKFSSLTNKRYANSDSGVGTTYDKEYDALFKELIKEADTIERALQKTIKDELESYKLTYYSLLISGLFIIILAGVVFYNYEKEKLQSVLALKRSNDKLEETKASLLETNNLLDKLANTDKLTQLNNRLKLDSIFDSELQRAFRYQNTFSIILLDIDSFKKINDDFGHDIGDYALIEISNILKNTIRSTDYVGRFGGEEFLVICPQTDKEKTSLLAEKLRVTIENFKFKTIGTQTCSFGVSELLLNDTSKDEMIKRADKALYEAKNSGKNKVAVY